MTALEKRDRRRAKAAMIAADRGLGWLFAIAAALKREREETSMAAAQWFLFAGKNQKAKVKRHLSKSGATANFEARKAAPEPKG